MAEMFDALDWTVFIYFLSSELDLVDLKPIQHLNGFI